MPAPPYEIAGAVLKMRPDYAPPGEVPEPDLSIRPELAGYYGSAHPDFLSDFRFVMGTLGALQVKVKGDELVLTDLRHSKPHVLRQVDQNDPFFYLIENEDAELQGYIRFVQVADGSVGSVIIGMNEHVRLEGTKLAQVMLKAGVLFWMPADF